MLTAALSNRGDRTADRVTFNLVVPDVLPIERCKDEFGLEALPGGVIRQPGVRLGEYGSSMFWGGQVGPLDPPPTVRLERFRIPARAGDYVIQTSLDHEHLPGGEARTDWRLHIAPNVNSVAVEVAT